MDKLNGSVNRVEKSTVSLSAKFSEGFNRMKKSVDVIKLDSMLNNIDRVASGLNSLNEPGLNLSTTMADVEAITGVTGQKLKELEGYARSNAKTFGGSAARSAESYKLVLSQLGPEIANVPKALREMGNSVSTTSKLMAGNTTAATEVLTTAMNQYQVSTDDPIKASEEMARMMNVMAAAGKAGSAELPDIKNALEQSGMAAKSANVYFEETNAWIQMLDKSGKKGSEGGVALRNVMATLSQGRFLPKDVQAELQKAGVDITTLTDKSISLADRLRPLEKIMTDDALLTKLFGKENQNAAIAMISQIDAAKELTTAITGTNTAYEQAEIVMNSQEEKNKKLKARVDAFKISLFNATGGLMGYAAVLADTARDVSNLIPLLSGMGTVISTLTSKTKLLAIWEGITSTATSVWTGAQWLLNAAFWANPITWVVAGVIALVAAITWVVSKTEGWGTAWKHTINGAKLLFQSYVAFVRAQFNTLVNGLMIGINKIKLGWFKFKEMMGLGDSAKNQEMIRQIQSDTEARKKSIVDGYKKATELGIQATSEFVQAGMSIKWKSDKQNATVGAAGIKTPTIPGTTNSESPSNSTSTGTEGAKTNTAIATGGTKHNYITINLNDLIGVLNITGKDFKETNNKMTEQVQDALLRLLAMATTAGN